MRYQLMRLRPLSDNHSGNLIHAKVMFNVTFCRFQVLRVKFNPQPSAASIQKF
jgi:hypothetical protein